MSEPTETPESLRALAATSENVYSITRKDKFLKEAAELRARAEELEILPDQPADATTELPIGPNSCPYCSGEYGEHADDCPKRDATAEQAGKPTAGPWKRDHDTIYAQSGEPLARVFGLNAGKWKQIGDFIVEAGTVYHETGLSPRQLAEALGANTLLALDNKALYEQAKGLTIAIALLKEQLPEVRDARSAYENQVCGLTRDKAELLSHARKDGLRRCPHGQVIAEDGGKGCAECADEAAVIRQGCAK